MYDWKNKPVSLAIKSKLRFDLEVPDFHNGEQNGVTYCYSTLREAIDGLKSLGCTVEREA